MIIDIRCRYISKEDAEYFRHSHQVEIHQQPEDFITWLDRQGVNVALSPVSASLGLNIGRWDLPERKINNEQQAQMQKLFPTRFVGVAGIDPGNVVHNALEELERCVKTLGLNIASIEPGRKPMLANNPADKRLYDFYSYAQELDVPIILQTSGLKGGQNIDYAHPRWIDQIAHDFPDLHIICAHGCAPYHRELALVTRRRPNVFASPDLYTFLDFEACRWTHPEQLIFASGYPFVSVRPLIKTYLNAPWDMNLDNIMARNAIRALKLDRDPFFARQLTAPPVFKVTKPQSPRQR